MTARIRWFEAFAVSGLVIALGCASAAVAMAARIPASTPLARTACRDADARLEMAPDIVISLISVTASASFL